VRWLTTEVACLPEVFASVNENFISVAVDGVLVMANDSINLPMLQASAIDSGLDVRPGERVLMTKFGKSEKIRSFGFLFRIVQFR
jgi:hypothetical protein